MVAPSEVPRTRVRCPARRARAARPGAGSRSASSTTTRSPTGSASIRAVSRAAPSTVLDALTAENLDATREAISSLPLATLGEPTTEELVGHAVGVFMRAQRADRAWVLGSAELRLHAARSSTIRSAYRDRVERSTREFVALIEGTAAQLGYELAVPGAAAIDVLNAVFEHGAVGAVIAGEDVAGDVRTAQLGAVLRSLLRPAARRPGASPRGASVGKSIPSEGAR